MVQEMSEESIKLQVFEQVDELLVHQQLIAKGAKLRVGRNPEYSDLKKVRLADPRISQLHFSIAFDGAAIRLTDLDSSNGVWLDGKLFKNECVEINLNDRPSKSIAFFAGSPTNSKYEFVLIWDENSTAAPSAPITIESHPERTVVDDDDDSLFEFTNDEVDSTELTADSIHDSASEIDLGDLPNSEKATEAGGGKTKEDPPKSDSD